VELKEFVLIFASSSCVRCTHSSCVYMKCGNFINGKWEIEIPEVICFKYEHNLQKAISSVRPWHWPTSKVDHISRRVSL